jgi:methylmalonyl-CoA mutase
VDEAIRGGADGIELVLDGSAAAYGRGIGAATAEAVLDGLERVTRIDAGEDTPRLVRACGGVPDAAFDPLSTLAVRGLSAPIDAAYDTIAGLVAEADAGAVFATDGRLWHNAGASEVQELGIALASAVAALRHLAEHGCPPARTAGRFGVTLAADADQFLTIAKLRAARLLFARLAEVTGFDCRPPIHAETSWRMLARREPTMNMVRATTAAFAAATGGADSITVLSPLLADEAFSARMARNTQIILRDESGLYRGADPGAGSGAIEDLTGRLAAAAWELFTRIESEGGLLAAIESGSIRQSVAAMRDARLAAVARRTAPMVGVNVNVDPGTVPPSLESSAGQDSTPLPPVRLAAPIEAIGARIAAGGRNRVALVGGATGDHGIGDALTALGFAVEPVQDVDDLAAPVPAITCVVVRGEEWSAAADTAQALRNAGVTLVLAAAAIGDDVAAAGFDALLTPDTDLVDVVTDLLDRDAERQEKEEG